MCNLVGPGKIMDTFEYVKFVKKDSQPNLSMKGTSYKTTKITAQFLHALNVRNRIFQSKI